MRGIVEARIVEAIVIAMVGLLGGLPAWAEGPSRLVIDPNAIASPDEPIEVVIEGVEAGDTTWLFVLQDCNGDSQPDRSATCPPLFDRESARAHKGVIRDRLEVDSLKKLPRNVPLWLRATASREGSGQKAMFTLGGDGCGFFAELADLLGGPCQPASLLQMLRRHRQPSDLQDAILEVRLLDLGNEDPETTSIPRTRGASGVAWAKESGKLLLTIADPDRGALAPGVYRVKLEAEASAAPEPIWTPTIEECQAHAPRALGAERLAVVCQAPGPQTQNAAAEPARLVVVEKGKVARSIPLPLRIHQLLASSGEGQRILALSLGIADNQPVFLSIDLEAARAEIVGFSNAFYQSAMREPGGERSLIAFENAYGGYGWQLALANGDTFTGDAVKRTDAHDLAPTWHPEGKKALYLAQVDTVASSP